MRGARQPMIARMSSREPVRPSLSHLLQVLSQRDPGRFALKNAVRAGVVAPALFAIALKWIELPQMALFAAFGSMAFLVFVDFGGPPLVRLRSYLLLVVAGAILIPLGTLCSHSVVLATVAMAIVSFAIIFSGVLSGAIAAAQPAAILLFVLPVMVTAPFSSIPARLAGLGLAGAAAISATLLVWPTRPRDRLRVEAGVTANLLADLLATLEQVPGDEAERTRRIDLARDAVRELRERFVATPNRPSGTGGRTAALARLVDDVGWLLALVRQPALLEPPTPALATQRAEVLAAGAQVLRASADQLDGGSEQPDLERLGAARESVGVMFLASVARSCRGRDEQEIAVELTEAFELRALAHATWLIGRDALLACGRPAPALDSDDGARPFAAARQLAGAHVSLRSVWLHNSLRGAVALTLAVLVAQLADVQNSFWVVLATLSVLRSQALATGSTALRAIAGTLAGIVVGGLLVAAVGHDTGVLWAVLPFAVLLAAYAPRVLTFVAGQAAFTLVVLILFNLLSPVGWRVGIVRAEDIGIGVGISVLVGLLLWPRGVGRLARDDVADAYERVAALLDAAIVALVDGGERGTALDETAREATAASERLDDSTRQLLAERTSAHERLHELTTLIAGMQHVRRAADLLHGMQEIAASAPPADPSVRLAAGRAALLADTHALTGWYASLGESVAAKGPAPAPESRGDLDAEGRPLPPEVVLEPTDGIDGTLPPGVAIAWTSYHLELLRSVEPRLARAADQVRQIDA